MDTGSARPQIVGLASTVHDARANMRRNLKTMGIAHASTAGLWRRSALRDVAQGEGGGPRIGVIGAGAAGLSAAHELQRAGYRNVVVLERSDRVGGTCHTFHHEGRSFELGAAALTVQYRSLRRLMKEVGLSASPVPNAYFCNVETGQRSFLLPPEHRKWLDLGVGGARFAAELLRHRELWKPGLHHYETELAAPFSEWVKARGFMEIAEAIRPWFTGFGYGYFEDMPAAYVLKYVTICAIPLFEIMDGGFQGLWERVASPLDVHLKTNIRRIVRDGSVVRVETDAEALELDALIIACPVDSALEILDASPEERALLSKLRYVDYRVVAASVEGLSRERYTFCPRNLHRSAPGEPMFWNRRWKDSDVVLFYSIGEPAPGRGGTIGAIEKTLTKLGAKLTRVHREMNSSYFPHVGPDEMRAGFFRRFEALQGARQTYYTGEALNFPSIETVVAYSRKLVEQRFPSLVGADGASLLRRPA